MLSPCLPHLRIVKIPFVRAYRCDDSPPPSLFLSRMRDSIPWSFLDFCRKTRKKTSKRDAFANSVSTIFPLLFKKYACIKNVFFFFFKNIHCSLQRRTFVNDLRDSICALHRRYKRAYLPDLNGEHVESSERASSIFRCIVDKSDWSYFASIELFEIRFGRFVQSLCIGASMCDIGYTAQDTAYFPAYRSCISSIKKFISFRSISTSNIDVEFSFPRSLLIRYFFRPIILFN